MSESEQTGRCRREITAAYESTRYKPSDSDMLVADAIDRLAADVAAIKAKADSVTISLSPEDVAHFVECEKAWVTLVEEQRDAAIRERDAANQRRADTVRRLVQAQAEVAQLRDSRDVANRLFGAEQAKVERLRKELDDREQTEQVKRLREANETLHRKSINYIHDRDQYRRERDEALAEAQRLKVELYDREQEILSLRADTVERCEPPAAPQPAAPPAGWLTEDERGALSRAFDLLCDDDGDNPLAGTVQALLARAGLPPVVEVPEEKPGLGHLLHRLYRDAISRAGISWKEVPRE